MLVNSRVSTGPTWAEVSLAHLAHNFRAVQAHVGTSLVCAVVKADAYGHGAVACSRALEEAGARWVGGTNTDEALALRQSGLRGRILLMTGFWPGEGGEGVRQDRPATCWETGHLAVL